MAPPGRLLCPAVAEKTAEQLHLRVNPAQPLFSRHSASPDTLSAGYPQRKRIRGSYYRLTANRFQEKRPAAADLFSMILAEAVRFELTDGYKPSPVFKTGALNHSATLP